MVKDRVLSAEFDFLKGSDISKEGLSTAGVIDASTPNPRSVESEASAHAENDLRDKKLQEKIDRSMDAIKQFIRSIDVNAL